MQMHVPLHGTVSVVIDLVKKTTLSLYEILTDSVKKENRNCQDIIKQESTSRAPA
jgi:hypothetical protein